MERKNNETTICCVAFRLTRIGDIRDGILIARLYYLLLHHRSDCDGVSKRKTTEQLKSICEEKTKIGQPATGACRERVWEDTGVGFATGESGNAV